MTRDQLLQFVRSHRICVEATRSNEGAPQAAVVGFAVSDDFEFVFDSLGNTRKIRNLRLDTRVALVVGWDAEQTVQIEGVADEPKGADLERLKKVYFAAYPDGVERLGWDGITHVRVKPHWMRYSDFRAGGSIVEWGAVDLRAAR
jgi:hypothetical protein